MSITFRYYVEQRIVGLEPRYLVLDRRTARIIGHFGERVDANRAAAHLNREYHLRDREAPAEQQPAADVKDASAADVAPVPNWTSVDTATDTE